MNQRFVFMQLGVASQYAAVCQELSGDGLTVVISSLKRLMKDQVDFLLDKGVKAATIGEDPVERFRC